MENLKKVKETILELIYPSKCPFCGEIVSAGKKHSMEHNGICKACREKLPYIGEVRCMCCGKPLTDPAEEYCYDCTRQKHLFVDGRTGGFTDKRSEKKWQSIFFLIYGKERSP